MRSRAIGLAIAILGEYNNIGIAIYGAFMKADILYVHARNGTPNSLSLAGLVCTCVNRGCV